MIKYKYFPSYLYQTRLGNYFISPFESLKVDYDLKTIWLDLNTPKILFKKDNPDGGLNYRVSRISFDSSDDFKLNFPLEISSLFQLFEGISLSIPQIVNYIINPEQLDENQKELKDIIKSTLQPNGVVIKSYLIKFLRFIEDLPKENLPKLLEEKNYACVFGNLDYDLQFKNNVMTKVGTNLEEKSISPEVLRKYFGKTILSEKTFLEVFVALGMNKFLNSPPILPENGGSIFIDMGGTGKSMIKAALQKFWTQELDGACIEKNGVAEFTNDTNYARLIRSWYYGSQESDGVGYDKEGLFKAAIKNKIPSLLIVDEADRFVKTHIGDEKDAGAEAIITEFKKYLTGRDKGGVQGYVLTLFIANVNREELSPQLAQGGERLSVVYFGPPTSEENWLSLLQMYFEKYNLIFEDRTKENDLLLAKLILYHNSKMPQEKFMISPRRFGSSFCGDYLAKHNPVVEEENSASDDMFSKIHKSLFKKSKLKKIEYVDFFKNIIDDLLLKQVEDANGDVAIFRKEYFNLISLNGNNTKSTNTSNYSQEEQDELTLILNDPITKRIISSKYFFEVLGIKSETKLSFDELKKMSSSLKFKFAASNGYFTDSNSKKHNISTEIAIELLTDINYKILDTPKKAQFNEKYIQIKVMGVDFSKYSL